MSFIKYFQLYTIYILVAESFMNGTKSDTTLIVSIASFIFVLIIGLAILCGSCNNVMNEVSNAYI